MSISDKIRDAYERPPPLSEKGGLPFNQDMEACDRPARQAHANFLPTHCPRVLDYGEAQSFEGYADRNSAFRYTNVLVVVHHIPLHLRSDAKAQFDHLVASSESFRRNVGAIHHLVACRAARVEYAKPYRSRTEVYTESIRTRTATVLAVDFRVEDGPLVVIEGYAFECGGTSCGDREG